MKKAQINDPVIQVLSLSLLFLCIASLFQHWLIYMIFIDSLICSTYLWITAKKQTNLQEGNRKIDVYRSMIQLSIFLSIMFFLVWMI